MIGKALQDLILLKGTNPNELAKTSGVSAQTLYSIIKRDNMKIDFDVLIKICNALEVPAEYFYNAFTNKKEPSISEFSDIDDPRIQYIIKCFDNMNEDGKDSLYNQATMHSNNENYKKAYSASDKSAG